MQEGRSGEVGRGTQLQENLFYTQRKLIRSFPPRLLTLLCLCSPDDKEGRLMGFAAAEKMKIVLILLPVYSLPAIRTLGSNANFRVH